MALPASTTYPRALQTAVRTSDDGSVYFFAKTGVIWRNDASFDLVVPEELQPVLAIGWGETASAAHQVSLRCDEGGKGEWIAAPGGYWISEPICAQVVVRSDDEEQTVGIGLGAPCPGQAPPVDPTAGPDGR